MRQNMEELTATQEDFVRREAELKAMIEQLRTENDTLRLNKMPSDINSLV